MNAEVNSTAIIQCSCNQTGRRVPHWIINDGLPLRYDELPLRHTIIDLNLIISPVQQNDNGSTYQCVFLSVGLPVGIKIKLMLISPRGIANIMLL